MLGVVPVPPEAEGAASSVALRRLAGRALILHAVTALLDSGRIDTVLVSVPGASSIGPVRDVLAGERELAGCVDVATGPFLVLPPGTDPDDVVVVHDVLHPLAPPVLVAAVVDALERDPTAVGALAVRAVTDTLKWVDGGGRILGTADREAHRVLCSPQAYRAGALASLAADAALDTALLPGRAGALGRLVAVPAGQDVFRVAEPDDLALAEAVLRAARTVPEGVRR